MSKSDASRWILGRLILPEKPGALIAMSPVLPSIPAATLPSESLALSEIVVPCSLPSCPPQPASGTAHKAAINRARVMCVILHGDIVIQHTYAGDSRTSRVDRHAVLLHARTHDAGATPTSRRPAGAAPACRVRC